MNLVHSPPGRAWWSASTTTPAGIVSGPRLLPHLERLDDVSDLDVVVRAEREAALEALPNLDHVVLEPAQRAHRLVLHHDDVVPEQPGAGVAPDLAGEHHAAGDGADLRRAEHL